MSKEVLNRDEDAVSSIPMWIYSRYNQKKTAWRGIITKNYSFSMSKDGDSTNIYNVLFDRKKDPYQLNNLYNNPDYKDVKENLKKIDL